MSFSLTHPPKDILMCMKLSKEGTDATALENNLEDVTVKTPSSPIPKILLFLILSISASANEAVLGPEIKSIEDEIRAISKEMALVADQLRADRADSTVQLDQKSATDRLAKLIKAIEDAKPSDQKADPKKKPLAVFESEMKAKGGSGSGGNNPGQGGPPAPTGTKEDPPKVAGRFAEWGKLPKSSRDELLSAMGNDVPLRWRKKLEAYFLSIAAEETKKR